MRNIFLILFIALCAIGLYGARVLENAGSDVLKQLGTSDQQVKEHIWSSFSGRYLSYPMSQKIRQIARGERGAIVRDIGEFARRYTKSQEFMKLYMEYRDGMKPIPPEKPKSAEQMRKEQKEELRKNLRETEETMKTMPADQREAMKEVVAMFKEQIKSYDDPNNPMFGKEIDEMNRQMYEDQIAEHKRALAQWEREYPPSPNAMVIRWLENFLAASNNVDYDAKLVDGEYGKKVFAKRDYEQKSPEWKMCYRSGREAVEAGRKFASEWLNELKKQL